ncbi:MAG: response regulator transcription factor [Flavobacteriales bacterium]|nr:response regulator transcription factor [Flavobacteriales bacterium]
MSATVPPDRPPVRIALVDDHLIMRTALAGFIDRLGGYEVVLQAGNGEEYINALKDAPRIDVAIVDLHMPVMDGYATIAWIRANTPKVKPLALTFEKTEEAMIKALRAGSCGFLLKDVNSNVFRQALHQVVTIGHFHSEEVELALTSGELLTRLERQRAQVMELLSDREIELIRLVCHEDEYTYDQIAAKMDVSRRTVDGYREDLFARFDIKSKTGLVLFAFKWGLVEA